MNKYKYFVNVKWDKDGNYISSFMGEASPSAKSWKDDEEFVKIFSSKKEAKEIHSFFSNSIRE